MVAVAVVVALGAKYSRDSWSKRFVIQNPEIAPLSMNNEGDGADGPFFPSSSQVAGDRKIPSKFFMESDACERCHQDIYKQWNSSAHHFSSFNNQWYRKSIEYMQDVNGVKPSKWCAGCHDPALLYSGMMDTPIKQIVHTSRGAGGHGLHDVPLHREGEEHDGAGRLHARVSRAARAGGDARIRCCAGCTTSASS